MSINIAFDNFLTTSSDNLWPSFDELPEDAFGAEQVGIFEFEEVNPPDRELTETIIPVVKEEEEQVLTTTITTTTTTTASSNHELNNYTPPDTSQLPTHLSFLNSLCPLPKLETSYQECDGIFGVSHKKVKIENVSSSTLFPSVCLSRKQLLEFSCEEHEQHVKDIRAFRHLTEEEEVVFREQRRLIKNREAASNSRARKKTQIETLSEEIIKLKQEQEAMEKDIERRTVENLWIKNEVQYLTTLVQQSKALSAAFELFQKKPIEASEPAPPSKKRKSIEEDLGCSEVPNPENCRETLPLPNTSSRSTVGSPA